MTAITDLKSLQAEKARLSFQADQHLELIKEDMETLKKELSPISLLNKAAKAIVPEVIRHSGIINTPINFIAKKIFGAFGNIVIPDSDTRRSSPWRNIGLGFIESAGTYFLMKLLFRNKHKSNGSK